MKITETIKESTIRYILSGILAILGFLAGSIYSEAVPTFLPLILQSMSKTLILKLLLGAIIICVLLLALSLIIYLHFKTKLMPKIGVVWDKKAKEPYCPNCEKSLARHKTKFNGDVVTALNCTKCKEPLPLITDDGRRITLKEAKELL